MRSSRREAVSDEKKNDNQKPAYNFDNKNVRATEKEITAARKLTKLETLTVRKKCF